MPAERSFLIVTEILCNLKLISILIIIATTFRADFFTSSPG
nr:MAG TPA: hypothetical protein [Caudoviricetes sp.]DAT31396.1 MAG TPA: hypothetical protein [Caudoviricetes sp.]